MIKVIELTLQPWDLKPTSAPGISPVFLTGRRIRHSKIVWLGTGTAASLTLKHMIRKKKVAVVQSKHPPKPWFSRCLLMVTTVTIRIFPFFLHLFATYLWSPAAVPGPSWPRCSWCWSSAPPSHCRTPRRTFACRPRPCWRSSRSAWGASPAAAVVLPEAALEKHQGAPGWIHSKSVGPQDVRTREVHLFGAEPRREDNGNVGSAGIPPGVLFVPGLSATFPPSTMSLFFIHNFPHVHPCFIFRSSCNLLQSSICIYAGWWFGTFIIVP